MTPLQHQFWGAHHFFMEILKKKKKNWFFGSDKIESQGNTTNGGCYLFIYLLKQLIKVVLKYRIFFFQVHAKNSKAGNG